jgi:hypothetical protein
MESTSSNTNSNSDNILFPIDLSIFQEHVKLSFLSILDSVKYMKFFFANIF